MQQGYRLVFNPLKKPMTKNTMAGKINISNGISLLFNIV
jgi:hypothetical protein